MASICLAVSSVRSFVPPMKNPAGLLLQELNAVNVRHDVLDTPMISTTSVLRRQNRTDYILSMYYTRFELENDESRQMLSVAFVLYNIRRVYRLAFMVTKIMPIIMYNCIVGAQY